MRSTSTFKVELAGRAGERLMPLGADSFWWKNILILASRFHQIRRWMLSLKRKIIVIQFLNSLVAEVCCCCLLADHNAGVHSRVHTYEFVL